MHLVESRLAELWPPDAWRDVTVVVAVSGGADSVALLRAMTALQSGGSGRLCVAHLDHGLRGEASAADADFVARMAEQLGLHSEIGRLVPEELRRLKGQGLESQARRARYRFLRRITQRLGARYVVTAHTADDQVETILHRALRGTGIRGLAGIPRVRLLSPATTLIRPLLELRRSELLAYLNDLGQPYCDDATNADTRFARNRIRQQLLPLLARDFNPDVAAAILRVGRLARDVQSIIDALVGRLLDGCLVEEVPGTLIVDASQLADQPLYLRRELVAALWRRQGWPLQAMGFNEWEALARLLSGGASGKRVFPGQVTAERAGELFRLTRHQAPSAPGAGSVA